MFGGGESFETKAHVKVPQKPWKQLSPQEQAAWSKDFPNTLAKRCQKHGRLLGIRCNNYSTPDQGWSLYNQLKDQAHKELNQGCRHALAGHLDQAKRAFAYSFQSRAICDWLFGHLSNWKPNKDDPDGAKHRHQFEILKKAHRALNCSEDGSFSSKDTKLFEKYKDPYHGGKQHGAVSANEEEEECCAIS